jgi:hypothetical protein
MCSLEAWACPTSNNEIDRNMLVGIKRGKVGEVIYPEGKVNMAGFEMRCRS